MRFFCIFLTTMVLVFPMRAPIAFGSDLKSDLELELDAEGDVPQVETKTKKKTRSESSGGGDRNVEEHIDLARSQVERKLYNEAVTTLKPLNDVLPRSGLLLLAQAYAGKKDFLNELRTLELCIAKNPKDYVVKTKYGKALLRQKGRVDDALAAFQEARTLNPLYRPAYDALLKELENKGERFEARNVVEDMRKRFGSDAKLLTTLCRLYALDEYNEAAKNACKQAIERAPNTAENHMYLGISLMNLEETKEAQKVLSSAARRFPSSEPVNWALGELATSKKDMITAYNYFKRAAEANSKSVRAWIGYGKSAFELQKLEESLTAFVNACKIDRHQIKEFRAAIGQLRVRKDMNWQTKFELGINRCM